MGWYSNYKWNSKEETFEAALEGAKVLVKTMRGQQGYAVCEAPNGIKYALVVVTEFSKDAGWGYKPMDESMGPYYYNCPKKYIKMLSPPMNDYSAKWREMVLSR